MSSVFQYGKYFGPVAHGWLEQRTHNPLVVCSTHTRPTKICIGGGEVQRNGLQNRKTASSNLARCSN